jgi:hypothetical protein
MDWLAWHRPYDDPDSPLARRLHVVQELVRAALDRSVPGPITAISICAGQGRDLLGVLVDHPSKSLPSLVPRIPWVWAPIALLDLACLSRRM